ncbi:MAG: dihydropteroate synthase [Gammaproteobacteria bacterium]|nr:dihydropteroate synthase [Gammaproteobacteria bacterium]
MSGPRLRCGDEWLDLAQPRVMGVLNVTPDSFSDGGRHADTAAAVARGLELIAEGAAIIDVGGESTRPGAAPVPVEEELRRVIPVIRGLAAQGRVLLSIDTSQPEVMRRAVDAGARLINDVRALQLPGALAAAAASGAGVCLMHMQGEPRTMQQRPEYLDVVNEVKAMLAARVQACSVAGIAAERLCLDPGIGFGKRLPHNLELLRRLPELGVAGRPLLIGLSRKSLLRDLTGRAVAERLAGSVALAAIAVMRGAHIVRAHDVAATYDAVRVAAAVRVGSD